MDQSQWRAMNSLVVYKRQTNEMSYLSCRRLTLLQALLIGVLILIAPLFLGCGGTMLAKADAFRAENRTNLAKLIIGMPKSEVLEVMGSETVVMKSRNPRDGGSVLNPIQSTYTNPHRVESYTSDSTIVEVLYYHTDVKELDGAITDDELTPIVLIDGKLVGWGWGALDETVEKFEIRLR